MYIRDLNVGDKIKISCADGSVHEGSIIVNNRHEARLFLNSGSDPELINYRDVLEFELEQSDENLGS